MFKKVERGYHITGRKHKTVLFHKIGKARKPYPVTVNYH